MRVSPFFKSAAWNLSGSVLPLCAGLFAIPALVASLGVERFGLLNLSWLLVGYFSLFDLGMGRALTRLVAEQIGLKREADVPRLVGTAISLMCWLGWGAAVLLAALSPYLATTWSNVAPELEQETLLALWVLSATLPFVVLAAGWRGVLEAYGRFDLVNWVRIPLGVAIFVAPLLVLPFAKGLVPVVASLAVTRILGWWFCRHQCRVVVPALAGRLRFERAMLRPLLNFGGWMTVSNIVGPLMVYADRFLVGGMISAAAVAYYSAPYEVVTRLWVISGAMTGVLFPIIAGQFLVDRCRAVVAYERAMKALFLALLPVVALLFLFAEEGLAWWLGPDFAMNGHFVARVLVVGVFVNALGQVAITALHGVGRADWAAKTHLLELPFYVLVLVYGASRYGIAGVAVAWLLRVSVDSLVMIAMVQRFWGGSSRFSWLTVLSTVSVMTMLGFSGGIGSIVMRASLLGLLFLVCGILLPRQMRLLGRATSIPSGSADFPGQPKPDHT